MVGWGAGVVTVRRQKKKKGRKRSENGRESPPEDKNEELLCGNRFHFSSSFWPFAGIVPTFSPELLPLGSSSG